MGWYLVSGQLSVERGSQVALWGAAPERIFILQPELNNVGHWESFAQI
jgi:hypothetical protein